MLDEFLSFEKHYMLIKKNVNARLYSLHKNFLIPIETKVQFFKTFLLPFFDYCSSLFIYMCKTLLNRFNRFFNCCIFRLFKLNLHNMNINEQANVLAQYNLCPYYYRIIERFAVFSKKIMDNFILNNIKCKLIIKINAYNLREKTYEKYNVPKHALNDGKRRISIFLPKFLNKILKNSYNNSFSQLKKHILSNMNTFYNEFIECLKN